MKLFDRGGKRGTNQLEPVEELRFQARCPAGHTIEGRRTTEFQAIRCPECGEGVFVLPTSWLPVPPVATVKELIPLHAVGQARMAPQVESDAEDSPESDEANNEVEHQPTPPKSKRRREIPLKSHQPEVDQSDLSDDPAARYSVQPGSHVNAAELARLAQADADEKARRKVRGESAGSDQEDQRRRRPASETDDDATDEPGEEIEETRSRRVLIPRPSPKVAIGVGVVLVIGLTVFFQLRQNRREQLPQLAQRGRTEGLQKLREGKFDEAKQILADAAAAYAEMNDRTEAARQITQAAREAAILADLVGRPLEEILDRYAAGGTAVSEFEAIEQGRSIVVESRVIATPEKGGKYDIDYRLAVGPGPASARPLGRLDLDSLTLMRDLKPNVGDTLLIGARLRKLELGDDEWVVRLDPDSGVLMTNWDALATIGWPVTDRPNETAEKSEAP